MKDLYEELGQDIEILKTSEGYMVLDTQTDEYLYDENGDNCFDNYLKACELRLDLITTRMEHYYD